MFLIEIAGVKVLYYCMHVSSRTRFDNVFQAYQHKMVVLLLNLIDS